MDGGPVQVERGVALGDGERVVVPAVPDARGRAGSVVGLAPDPVGERAAVIESEDPAAVGDLGVVAQQCVAGLPVEGALESGARGIQARPRSRHLIVCSVEACRGVGVADRAGLA
jgi:hypothetical protein